MGSELGIGYDSAGHAGYVDHWVQILTDTPKEIGYWGAMEQNAELRILLQIRSTIKSGVTEGLRNRCKASQGFCCSIYSAFS